MGVKEEGGPARFPLSLAEPRPSTRDWFPNRDQPRPAYFVWEFIRVVSETCR